jgi:hypothetical protein
MAASKPRGRSISVSKGEGIDMKEMASLAFWGFIAVVVIANVWREVAMRRETEMTIRMALEKGQQLDAATVDRLLRSHPKGGGGADFLLIAGGVTLATGLGLPIMGYLTPYAFRPLLGAGVLVSFIGAALLLLSSIVRGRRKTEQGLS